VIEVDMAELTPEQNEKPHNPYQNPTITPQKNTETMDIDDQQTPKKTHKNVVKQNAQIQQANTNNPLPPQEATHHIDTGDTSSLRGETRQQATDPTQGHSKQKRLLPLPSMTVLFD
jgi:hypothetical protein